MTDHPDPRVIWLEPCSTEWHTGSEWAQLPTSVRFVRADLAEGLEKALAEIQQRANESGNGPLGERETIYAMRDLATAALAAYRGETR